MHRPLHVAGSAEHCQHQGPAVGQVLSQLRRRAEAVLPWHLDVDNGYVRPARQCRGNELVAPTDLRDNFDILFELEQPPDRGAEHELVLGEENPNHRTTAPFRGWPTARPSRTRSANPRPPRAPPSSVPPNAWTRSASPVRPCPASFLAGPAPSSSTSSVVEPSVAASAIRQARAPLCLTTFVTASRIAHAIVVSC